MAEAKVILSAVDQGRAAFASFERNIAGTQGKIESLRGSLAGLAAVIALPALYSAFDQLNNQVAEFQGLSEVVGDTAVNMASLKLASDVSGIALGTIASASVRLTAALSKQDEESKGAAQAIKALGLEFGVFKKLSPVEQLDAVAISMGGFKDGAEKTAVAVALFGKSGAELMPFLNDLANGSERQTRLTKEQIKAADDYAKSMARLKSEMNSLAQELSGPVVVGMNGLIEKFKEGKREGDGFLVTLLKQTEIARLLGMSRPSNGYSDIRKDIEIIDGRLKGVNLSEALRNKLLENRAALLQKQAGYLTGERMNTRTDPRSLGLPTLDTSGLAANDKPPKVASTPKPPKLVDDTAAIARAQLQLDIDAIKKAGDELAATFANSEKIMEAVRAAGLLDEAQYYDARRGFIRLDGQAREDAFLQEIARYRQEKLTGKDKLENDRKIAAAESGLAQLRAKNVTELEVLSIQQQAANKRIARSYEEARVAAEQYLEITGKQYARDLGAFGKGDNARAKAGAFNAIDDRFQGQRDELNGQKRLLEFEGKFTEEARAQHDQRLAIIDEFQAKALAQWEGYYSALMGLQGNWENGANRALENYLEQAANIAGQTESLFANAFQGAEDALTSFVATGKADFKSLANSIVADITRMIIKQQIMAPLAQMVQGSMGGAGGGGGGSWFTSLLGSLFSGGMKSYAVGTDYVPHDMVARIHKGERIVPAAQNRPGAMGDTNVFHINVPQGTTRETANQIGTAVAQKLAMARARNG